MKIYLLVPAQGFEHSELMQCITHAILSIYAHRFGVGVKPEEVAPYKRTELDSQFIHSGELTEYSHYQIEMDNPPAEGLDEIVGYYTFRKTGGENEATHVDALKARANLLMSFASIGQLTSKTIIPTIEVASSTRFGDQEVECFGFLTYRRYENDPKTPEEIKDVVRRWIFNDMGR